MDEGCCGCVVLGVRMANIDAMLSDVTCCVFLVINAKLVNVERNSDIFCCIVAMVDCCSFICSC